MEIGGGCKDFQTEVFTKIRRELFPKTGDNSHAMEQRKAKPIPFLPLYCSCVQELCINHHQLYTAAHKSPSQDLHVLDELLNIA